MRKIGAIILVIALCVAAISGCSGNKEDGRSDSSIGDKKEVKDEVIIAIQSEPENGFDPTTGWGHGTTPLIQSTLVEYTQDMSIVNDLATNYTSAKMGLNGYLLFVMMPIIPMVSP